MLIPALRLSDPAMLARMEGIAEGAGLPLRSVCLLNAMEAFIAAVSDKTVVPLPGACSRGVVRISSAATIPIMSITKGGK
jgi:hypothetical protein